MCVYYPVPTRGLPVYPVYFGRRAGVVWGPLAASPPKSSCGPLIELKIKKSVPLWFRAKAAAGRRMSRHLMCHMHDGQPVSVCREGNRTAGSQRFKLKSVVFFFPTRPRLATR